MREGLGPVEGVTIWSVERSDYLEARVVLLFFIYIELFHRGPKAHPDTRQAIVDNYYALEPEKSEAKSTMKKYADLETKTHLIWNY